MTMVDEGARASEDDEQQRALTADEIRYQGEAAVDALLARAGVPTGEVASPLYIARRVLGAGCIIRTRSPLLGSLGRLGEQWLVSVRAGLPDAIALWVVGHELAHWERGTACGRGTSRADASEEAICDYAGAALQMPRAAFQRRLHEIGGARPWRQLALDFGTTETSAALRAGEVEERAIAVVCPHRVYARAPGWWSWPIEQQLRALARRGGPMVARARLRDDPRRVVLVPRSG